MDYYYLEYLLGEDSAHVTLTEGSGIVSEEWRIGAALTVAPAIPVKFQVLPGDEGALPPFINASIPLMSDALVAALHSAGADNLQTFEAIIEYLGAGTIHRGYKAVNVVGLVNCADEEDEQILYPAIDVTRARDFPIFRLATHAERIAVHRRIKDRIHRMPIGVSLDFRAARGVVEQTQEDPAGG